MLIDITGPIASAREAKSLPIVPSIIAVSKLTRCLVSLKLAKLDLKLGHDEILISLSAANAMTVSSISSQLSVTYPTAIKLINSLEAMNLVVQVSYGSSVITHIEITELGLQLQDKVNALYVEIESDVQKFMSPHVRTEVAYALMGVEGTLRRLLSKLQ